MICYDLYDYLNTCEPPPKMYECLKIIKYWGMKLENEVIDELGWRNIKKREVMYVEFGGTDTKSTK